eukprot:15367185-Ditylum_brightwellii.AAC.2
MKDRYHWESFNGKENLLQDRSKPSAERRECNIEGFSSLGDPSKNRDNGGDKMTKDDSVVDGEDPFSRVLPMYEVKKLVGDNLICGMCVKDKKKLPEEKLMNAIPYKYHGDVCSILRSVKGECGVKAKMKHIGCATSSNIKLVAAMFVMGVGDEEMANLLAFLDLHMANHPVAAAFLWLKEN